MLKNHSSLLQKQKYLLPGICCILQLAVLLQGCRMQYPETDYTVEKFSLAEGKQMTLLVCGSCHYNEATKRFSGKKMDDVPGMIGSVYASNITRHPEAATGKYTDAELARLIRTGVSRTGKWMPYMMRPNLSDEDLQNILAYLRSEDELVKPLAEKPGRTRYTPFGKIMLTRTKPLPYAGTRVAKPIQEVALGKYLVDNLACFHCHSKSITSLDYLHPEKIQRIHGWGQLDEKRRWKTRPDT